MNIKDSNFVKEITEQLYFHLTNEKEDLLINLLNNKISIEPFEIIETEYKIGICINCAHRPFINNYNKALINDFINKFGEDYIEELLEHYIQTKIDDFYFYLSNKLKAMFDVQLITLDNKYWGISFEDAVYLLKENDYNYFHYSFCELFKNELSEIIIQNLDNLINPENTVLNNYDIAKFKNNLISQLYDMCIKNLFDIFYILFNDSKLNECLNYIEHEIINAEKDFNKDLTEYLEKIKYENIQ